MALATDLRTDSKNCADMECFSNYNSYGSLTAHETGWHWLVISGPEESGSQWGSFSFNLSTPPDPPAHDGCEGAVSLPSGSFTIEDDLTAATNRFDPGRDGCPDTPGIIHTSRDVVYEVQLNAGQILDVLMNGDGSWDPQLYLVRDCEEPMGQCVEGGLLEDGACHLRYTAVVDEQLWLVCDSYGVGERPFTLSGSIDSTTGVPTADGTAPLFAAPNPFNPRTEIRFNVAEAGPVSLVVHALDGKVVAKLVDGTRAAGRHSVSWDGRDGAGRLVASGAYVVRMQNASGTETARLTLLK